ncbi:MAG: trehalose-phosphatase [Microbacterium sp.]|nr:trehalose-phosphatase [Microbacterium sp.]
MGRSARRDPRALRLRRDAPGAGRAVGGRRAALLRGLLQRHDLAAVPRRDRRAHLQAGVVGRLRPREPTLRRGGGRGRRRRGDRVGPGLSAAARAEDAARAPARPHDRLLPPHPVPRLRPVLAAAVAQAGARGSSRRGRHRIPARGGCRQLRARRPASAAVRDQGERDLGAGRRGRHARRAGQGVPDLDRRGVVRRDGAAPRDPAAGTRDPRRSGQPAQDPAGRRSPGLHQGHPPPSQGLGRDPRGRTRHGRGCHSGAGREPESRARRRLRAVARRDRDDGRTHQRRPRQHHAHRDPVPPPVVSPRGDGRAVPRRRRDARHGAPRRHEPRRQGVCRESHRQPRCPGAQRVRRCGGRDGQRTADQSARHRRTQGHDRAGAGDALRRAGAPHARPAQARPRPRRRRLVARVPRSPLGVPRPRIERLGGRRGGRVRRRASGCLVTAADAALEAVSTTPVLLVALDFDGTLAPLVDDPMTARMTPRARAAVDALAALPDTVVALVSGRSLGHLREIAEHDDASPVWLAASHGAQFWTPGAGEEAAADDADDLALRDRLQATISDGVGHLEGVWIEPKEFGVGVHTRRADAEATEEARGLADRLVAEEAPDWRRRTGHDILEFAFRHEGKDSAVARLRERTGATAVIFAGDDVTDEDALGALATGDLGIHVGTGDTVAALKVADIDGLVDVLEAVAHQRVVHAQ